MTKIRCILKSSKDDEGKSSVLLCISDRGHRAYFSTGFSATEKEFDNSRNGGRFFQGRGVKSFYVKRKEEDGTFKVYSNKEANDILSKLEGRASSILRTYNDNHINWGFDQFRNEYVNAPRRELFLAFAKDTIEKEYRAQGRHKSARIAMEAIRSLESYDPKLASRAFQDINAKYLNGYINFYRKRGNSDSTLKIRLGEIRRLFNIAIRERIASRELYPFSSGKEDGKIRIPRTIPNKTDQYLTLDSLRKLARTQFDNYALERTRHLFLFSFLCRGMNWKDMALLTRSSFYNKTIIDEVTRRTRQIRVMEYRRSKTRGQFEIAITPAIQRELDWFRENSWLFSDYVLPIIHANKRPEELDSYLAQVRKRFNHSLREIAMILEFPDSQRGITIYAARHSFAMYMQNMNKPVEVISQALGHQSVETTKHYLEKFSTTRMAEETYIDLLDD